MAPPKMESTELDVAQLTAAMEALTTADNDAARTTAADGVADMVKAAGAGSISSSLLESIKKAATDKKKVAAREGAALAVKVLCEKAGPAEEPYLAELVETAVLLQGDKAGSVREVAKKACDAFIALVSPFGARHCLSALFAGMKSSQWQAKVGALQMLQDLTAKAPKQVAACLPEIIPEVSDCMVDMKADVVTAATKTMGAICDVVGNKDIEPFIPTLIECITNYDEVPECVHKLASTTFVQAVEAPTLAIMGPLLTRGLARQQTIAIKRKSSVIIENMCKLVEDPADAAPFLPKLLPGLKHAKEEVSDPECRSVAARAFKVLLQAAGGKEQDLDDTARAVKEAEAETRSQLLQGLATATGSSVEDLEKFVADKASYYVNYVTSLCTNAILSKDFDVDTWRKLCVCPYVSVFVSADEADKVCVDFVEKAHALFESKKRVYVVEEEEGETLCDCDFSLAYGAMILLNNAKLHLKTGKRYGLCGPNGCGKSTLMRAINNGQVEGFPSPEEVRTVYVEHDIQASQADFNVVEFVLDEPKLKADGVTPDEVSATLSSFGFTEKMLISPITALSGGWKMKLALGRAILQKADILLLDEPTNHLDVNNVKWLENYLNAMDTVTSMIVSHDSGFLDNVCTHIIHYEQRKLVTYRGNLQAFVQQCPAAKKYYELSNDELKFTFPTPGYLEGVKNKDKAIVKMNNCAFKYPGMDNYIIEPPGYSVQVSLSSRVACVGPNGAGKSTFIKMMTGETEPTHGTVWKHQNMRYAYVAQHAFHHVEQHLDKTPNEYIRWRFSAGEDKENLTKVTAQYTPEEEEQMKQKIKVTGQEWQDEGVIEQLVMDKMLSRRQKKGVYEYEIQWVGKSMDSTTYMEREKIEKLGSGFVKYLTRVDEKEAARAGLYARPLTQKNVEKHLEDFGLDAEFGTHNRIRGLSGGQKVKVVLAAAMWQQPHVLVLDEPTNYLDRDALGALALAVKDFGGGVVMITHNSEFSSAICSETWTVGGGKVEIEGNNWNSGAREKVEFVVEEEVKDALGNTVKVKGPKKKLSRKDIKAKAKARKAKLENGEDLSTDSDWDLDEYIGDQNDPEAIKKAEEKAAKEAAKVAAKAEKEANKPAKKPSKKDSKKK